MAHGRTIVKDHDFYRKVLDKSITRFVEDLDVSPLLDLFVEKEFLPFTQVRDIREKNSTSEKVREILRKVRSKDVKGYKTFKKLLKESYQEHLVNYLERQESELEKKIKADKEKEQKNKGPVEATTSTLYTRVTNKDLNQTERARKEGASQISRQALIPDHQHSSSVTNNPSLEALQGELGRTRRTGALNSNDYGPDLSGKSFPQDPVPLVVSNASYVTQPTADRSGLDNTDAARIRSGDKSSQDLVTNKDLNQTERARKEGASQISSQALIPDHQHSSSVTNNPSLIALQGELGRTRRTGALNSNDYGPDLSGQSFPQESDTNPVPLVVSNASYVTQTIAGRIVLGNTDAAGIRSEDKSSQDLSLNMEGLTLEELKRSKSYIPPKKSCLFDGRLINLHEKDIEDLRRNNVIQIGQGAFGKVFKSENISRGFGMHVVLKKMPLTGGEQGRSIMREMAASRIMHPFILPLLAIAQPPQLKDEVWFVSPLCNKLDLNRVMKEERSSLKAYIRVKILLHVATAIQYIHTPVPNVRDAILHKDISSKNVVLDENYNARLIDFGLAREKNDVSSIAGGGECYSHPEKGHRDYQAREGWDYFAYGVIMRELLTGLGPEGEAGHYLKNMTVDEVEEIAKKANIWNRTDILHDTRIGVNKISGNVLVPENEWIYSDFREEVIKELQVIWKEFNQDILPLSNQDKCHICMVNPKVAGNSSMARNHKQNCKQEISTCIACEKNSFLNPITCYCGTDFTPEIGNRWGALLVAGKDAKKEKVNQAMAKDVREIEKLITSKAPRIIGIRKDNIRSVVCDESHITGNNKDEVELWPQVKGHIGHFSQRTDIDTLLIYISCHGEKNTEAGDGNENYFRLGSASDRISLKEFEEQLEQLENIEKLILILDRCYPPMVIFKDRNRKFCQINACRPDEETPILDDGSTFTKYFIRALKAKSVKSLCSDSCQHCTEYWQISTHFIRYSSLFKYLSDHMENESQKPIMNSNPYDGIFAYYTDEEVHIDFKDKNDNEALKKIPVEYLCDMKTFKEQLLQKFDKTVGVDNVKIFRQTYRKDRNLEECYTLENVMDAWVHRQQLIVSFSSD